MQVETPSQPAWWGLADKHVPVQVDESLDFTNGMLRDRLGVDEYKAKRIIRGMQWRGESDAGRMIGKFRWYRVISKT